MKDSSIIKQPCQLPLSRLIKHLNFFKIGPSLQVLLIAMRQQIIYNPIFKNPNPQQ